MSFFSCSIRIILLTLILVFILPGCNPPSNSNQLPEAGLNALESSKPNQYARHFQVANTPSYKHLSVFSPWKGIDDTLHYFLTDDPEELNLEGTIIKTPIRSIACLSTTHLGFISALGVSDRLVGVSGMRWVNDSVIQKRIEGGMIREIGTDQYVNFELIVDLKPDIVFAYGIDATSAQYIKKLQELGIQTVIISEYMESGPLGKMEWVKFLAAFFDLEEQANQLFQSKADRYNEIRLKATKQAEKPTVFTGLPWKGDWFVPGGRSFQAQFFKDAGAQYVWEDNQETSGTIMDIEVVFERALDADYWLNVSNVLNMEELKGLDARYARFQSFSNQKVYNNNKRLNPAQGNDYWESGVMNPDLILKDLVEIFHPGLFEAHQLYYHQNLQ